MKNQNQAKGKARKTRLVEPAKNDDPVLRGMWMTLNASAEFLRTHRLIEHEYIFVALSKAEARSLESASRDRKRSGETVIGHLEEGNLKTLFQVAAKSSVTVDILVSTLNRRHPTRLQLSRRPAGK